MAVGKENGLRGTRGDDLRGRNERRTSVHVFPQFYQVKSASKSWRQVAGRVTCDNVPETFLPNGIQIQINLVLKPPVVIYNDL